MCVICERVCECVCVWWLRANRFPASFRVFEYATVFVSVGPRFDNIYLYTIYIYIQKDINVSKRGRKNVYLTSEKRATQGLMIEACCCFWCGIRYELMQVVFIVIPAKCSFLLESNTHGTCTRWKRRHVTSISLAHAHLSNHNQPPLVVHQSQRLKFVAMATNGRAYSCLVHVHWTREISFKNSKWFGYIYIYIYTKKYSVISPITHKTRNLSSLRGTRVL